MASPALWKAVATIVITVIALQSQASFALECVVKTTGQDASACCASVKSDSTTCTKTWRSPGIARLALLRHSGTHEDCQELAEAHDCIVEAHEDGEVVVDQGLSVHDAADAWNLDRIDSPNLPLDSRYTVAGDGTGVSVFVLDTGIRSNHKEFEYAEWMGLSGYRVEPGMSFVDDNPSTLDCFGHGSHVAGTIAGLKYGVAKNSTLIPVKTIGCNGKSTTTAVIDGLDYAIASELWPKVACLSLSTKQIYTLLDEAVRAAVDAGVHVAIAAGNYNRDVCGISPANVGGPNSNAVVVGATTDTDKRWFYSDWGACMDLFAPGKSVKSVNYVLSDGIKTLSGTSMAAPAVAGAMAVYLQYYPNASPADVKKHILSRAVPDVVEDPGAGSPNLLLQVDNDALGSPLVSTSSEALRVAPVAMYSTSVSTTATRTFPIVNRGKDPLPFNVTIDFSGLFAGWVAANPSSGVLQPDGGTRNITLTYSSDDILQGVYEANVVISGESPGPTLLTVPITMYLLCPDLKGLDPDGPRSVTSAAFTLVHESWPAGWGMHPDNPPESGLYWEALLTFSHPVLVLDPSAFKVSGDEAGEVLEVTEVTDKGAACGRFAVRGYVPYDPWLKTSTEICVELASGYAVDIFGGKAQGHRFCTQQDHRPVGKLMGLYMVSSGADGAITDQQQVSVLAVFSEAISGLSKDSVRVQGPIQPSTVLALKQLPGTSSYYQITISLPFDHYGKVAVSLDGTFEDGAGNSNAPVDPLEFRRVRQPLVESIGYRLRQPESLQ